VKTCKKLACVALCAFLLFSAFPVMPVFASEAKTYYVGTNGDDSNDGLSEERAFKTIQKASSITYAPGDSLLFRAGDIFYGNFRAKGGGTAENPVTIGSYGEGVAPILTSTVADEPVILLSDVSGWTVSDVEITTAEGTGILISFRNTTVRDVTVKNVVLHDIKNYPSDTYRSGSRAALRIMGGADVNGAHAENITIDGCEIYNCGYGIFTAGNFPNTPEAPYNKNIVVENCSIHDLYDDAFIMAQTDTIILRNSSIINACQSVGVYYTAPVWTWGVTNALVENCEIAGAKNVLDGMAVDFDDHTDNSTYQYIYSHDNVRFMWNCPYDADDHYNNTVRYCLSVNDNLGANCGSYVGKPEHNFKFYNNTIINGSTYNFTRYDETSIQNNIFCLIPGEKVKLNKDYNYAISNNCYYDSLPTLRDRNSFFALPQFAGTDLTDKNSFMLKSCSPCIGAGVQVEEDMGERDFYGNALTGMHNIGCYEGDGVEGEYEHLNIFTVIQHALRGLYRIVSGGLLHAWDWLTDQFKK
jgi:hypothetical protein